MPLNRWLECYFHPCLQEHWKSIWTVNIWVFANTWDAVGRKLIVVISAFHWKEIIGFFFTRLLKWCHYQGNQWQLPETLWLLDRLEDCSMHQSLFQEITSASAIRNTSPRKGKKSPCDCGALRLRDIAPRTMVNSQLGQKHQQSVTERNLIVWHHCCVTHTKRTAQQQDIISLSPANSSSQWKCIETAAGHTQNDLVPQIQKSPLLGI